MKSNSVSNVLDTVTLAQGQKAGAAIQTGQTVQSFDMLLNSKNTAGGENAPVTVEMASKSNTVEQPQQTYEKEKSESGYKEITQISSSASEEKTEELKECQRELESKITEILTEKLDITEEELLEAMETMGITFESLLNGDGLKNLMMQLTEAEDTTDLLLSDVFQEVVQELDLAVQEFAEQLSITPEELKAAFSQTETMQEETLISSEETSVPVEQEKMSVAAENAETTETTKQGKAVNMETDRPIETEVSQEKAETIQVSETMSETMDGSGELKDESGQGKAMELKKTQTQVQVQDEIPQTQHTVTYQEVQTTVNSLGEEVTRVVEQTFVDVEDIMNQITEFTRVTVEQTQSSIEMQLNPAHLGKIYLQVAAKDGVITAQLAAQNEAVKQALENQVTVLKENMNQQGLKVEAVEITIATHEFEQNLENRRQQQQAEENAEREAGRSRRFLTADQLEELAGTLSEEESLAAKIMLENGNSMDMTA